MSKREVNTERLYGEIARMVESCEMYCRENRYMGECSRARGEMLKRACSQRICKMLGEIKRLAEKRREGGGDAGDGKGGSGDGGLIGNAGKGGLNGNGSGNADSGNGIVGSEKTLNCQKRKSFGSADLIGKRLKKSWKGDGVGYRVPFGEPGLKDVYMKAKIKGSYAEFLRDILGEAGEEGRRRVYRSDYEEIRVKIRVLKYLKSVQKLQVLPKAEIDTKRFEGLEESVFCVACRRAIHKKMTRRHAAAKAHAGEAPVYFKISRISAKLLLRRVAQYAAVFRKEIEHAVQARKSAESPRIEKIDPTRENFSKQPRRKFLSEIPKFTCDICNKAFSEEKEFLKHFRKKPHQSNLKKTLKEQKIPHPTPKAFEGIATKESILQRIQTISAAFGSPAVS